MESADTSAWHFVMWRTHDFLTSSNMDEIWDMDFDRDCHLFYLLDASQQIE
jgi:hypothetical protein